MKLMKLWNAENAENDENDDDDDDLYKCDFDECHYKLAQKS